MNPQMQFQDLGAGESFSPAQAGLRKVVLARGEVLLQRPARLLAGAVVLMPTERLQAPAEWQWEEGSCLVAANNSQLALQRRRRLGDGVRRLLAASGLARLLRPALTPA